MPVIVTIVSSTGEVEPKTRRYVDTGYVARVDSNILGRRLPFLATKSPPSTYIAFHTDGGIVTVNGVEVTMEPLLSTFGRKPVPDAKLRSIQTPPLRPIGPLVGLNLAQAESAVRAASLTSR